MARLSYALALLSLSLLATAQHSELPGYPPTFTPEQIRADFESMYDGLQLANFDLYAFTSRSEFDSRYRAMSRSFVEPMTRFDIEMAFRRFAALRGARGHRALLSGIAPVGRTEVTV